MVIYGMAIIILLSDTVLQYLILFLIIIRMVIANKILQDDKLIFL